MGRLFKKSRDGKRTGPWVARYRDGNGIVRERSTGCKDKSAAQAVVAEWERHGERQRAGLVSALEAEAADWAHVAVVEHIADWKAALEAKGRTARHARDMEHKMTRLADDLRFRRLADLSRPRLEGWLAERHAENMPARTLNGYAGAAVAFGNWLVRAGRMAVNPFAGIEKRNEKADRRHVRRAFTAKELGRLLEAAEQRPVRDAMFIGYGTNKGKPRENVKGHTIEKARRLGRERALFYRLMAFTGLRSNEARTLRVADLDLDGPRPCVLLEARHEKARRGAQIPLRDDLRADLARYLEERLAWLRADSERHNGTTPARLNLGAALFPNAPASVRVFYRDLKAAGIPKADARGRVLDLHSLRVTFNSLMAAAGVPLATRQVLMRHSDPRLTAGTYTDPAALDVVGAVESLPATHPEQGAARKVENGPEKRPLQRPPFPVKSGQFPAFHGTEAGKARTATELRLAKVTPAKTAAFQGVSGKNSTEKDGSGAGTRTPDTWIMIPRTPPGNPLQDSGLTCENAPASPLASPFFPETSPENVQEPAPADPGADPVVSALAGVLGNLTDEQRAALVAALTGGKA